jgi:hypothetical protein
MSVLELYFLLSMISGDIYERRGRRGGEEVRMVSEEKEWRWERV